MTERMQVNEELRMPVEPVPLPRREMCDPSKETLEMPIYLLQKWLTFQEKPLLCRAWIDFLTKCLDARTPCLSTSIATEAQSNSYVDATEDDKYLYCVARTLELDARFTNEDQTPGKMSDRELWLQICLITGNLKLGITLLRKYSH